MRRELLLIILVAVGAYGLLRAGPLIAGPELQIDSPVNYGSYEGGLVTISGFAGNVAELTVNGAPLLKEENGRFSEVRTFPRGGSILTLVATDRFGRSVTATRDIYVPSN